MRRGVPVDPEVSVSKTGTGPGAGGPRSGAPMRKACPPAATARAAGEGLNAGAVGEGGDADFAPCALRAIRAEQSRLGMPAKPVHRLALPFHLGRNIPAGGIRQRPMRAGQGARNSVASASAACDHQGKVHAHGGEAGAPGHAGAGEGVIEGQDARGLAGGGDASHGVFDRGLHLGVQASGPESPCWRQGRSAR